ncbi:MAG: hypothetical protein HYS44_01730 [Candidatus Niyogibacteria bacterium]|nr:hypothetical protein [Candidatus Niyogibacteria bacterium]
MARILKFAENRLKIEALVHIRWFVLFFLIFLWSAEARAVDIALALELNTPAEPILSEIEWNGEYEWRERSALGRFSGRGFYDWSDVTRDWFTRHSLNYAPLADAPFLAAAVEYGASNTGEFWQGGAAVIASRLPALRETFDHLALTYFTDMRDSRFSSEWVLHAEMENETLRAEFVYRYRPSVERASDSGLGELWFKKPLDAVGILLQKTGERWMPWLGYRLQLF